MTRTMTIPHREEVPEEIAKGRQVIKLKMQVRRELSNTCLPVMSPSMSQEAFWKQH